MPKKIEDKAIGELRRYQNASYQMAEAELLRIILIS